MQLLHSRRVAGTAAHHLLHQNNLAAARLSHRASGCTKTLGCNSSVGSSWASAPKRPSCTTSTTASSSSYNSSRRAVLTAGAAPVCLTAGARSWVLSGGKAAASLATVGAGRMAATAAAAASGTDGPTSETGVLVVYVTAPSADVAGSIAEQLVTSKLAACVNILPGITSVYTWKGKVEKDSEVLMIIKTQQTLLEQLTAKVKELHPYDEPEVVGLPVVGGSASYLAWVKDNTT